ncbi:sulfurtransferase TusA family protein [Pseudokordiimonas caeni]|uniref:sulfurtransferase TusA family protein n=1 Tax=Pseudokordiimonas caeni TaxID=2997908 RepID=UPI002811CB85|nr:sulfurtransferase TusA family protein [Pseudokordiimonas caeni]
MKELDTRGLKCPMPVLRLRRALDDLKPGERLHLTASDPVTAKDIPAFCTIAGHRLLMAEVKDGIYHFDIEKGADETAG